LRQIESAKKLIYNRSKTPLPLTRAQNFCGAFADMEGNNPELQEKLAELEHELEVS
jgi:hypothetical protein